MENKKFGYLIINKETNQVVDKGNAIFKSEKAAIGDAEIYLTMALIPNEFPSKTLKDFDIVVKEITNE